jgi:hypothetical protein
MPERDEGRRSTWEIMKSRKAQAQATEHETISVRVAGASDSINLPTFTGSHCEVQGGLDMHSIYSEQLGQQSTSRRTGGRPAQRARLAVVCLLLLGLGVLPMASAQDFAAQALDYVAGQQGVALGDLQITGAAQAHLPLTGVELAEFKVLASDGRGVGVRTRNKITFTSYEECGLIV